MVNIRGWSPHDSSSHWSPDWPTCGNEDCRGVRVVGVSNCLRHVNSRELAFQLGALRAGRQLDARGTVINATLLRQLLDAFPTSLNARNTIDARFDFAEFSDAASFNYAVFGSSVSFDSATFLGAASFDGVIFEGAASFENVKFNGGCTFRGSGWHGQASLIGTTFSKGAVFDRARFWDALNLSNITNEGIARFFSVRCEGAAAFTEGTFGEEAYFDHAVFSGGVSFASARFGGEAHFYDTKFLESGTFDEVWFSKEVTFDEAWFLGTTRFNGCQFEDGASFRGAIFSGDTVFMGSTFHRSTIFSGARLEGSFRIGQTTGEMNLGGAQISHYSGRQLFRSRQSGSWRLASDLLSPIVDGFLRAWASLQHHRRMRTLVRAEQRPLAVAKLNHLSQDARIGLKKMDVRTATPTHPPPTLNDWSLPPQDGDTADLDRWLQALQATFEASGVRDLIPGFKFASFGFATPGVNDEEAVLSVIVQAVSAGPEGHVTALNVNQVSFPIFVRRHAEYGSAHSGFGSWPAGGSAACWAELKDPVAGERRRGVLTAGHVVGLKSGVDPLQLLGRKVKFDDGDGTDQVVLAIGDRLIDAAVISVPDQIWRPGLPLSVDANPGVGSVVWAYLRGSRREWTTILSVTNTFGVPTSPHIQNWIFLENAFAPGDSGSLLVDDHGRALGLYLGDFPTALKSKEVIGRCQNLAQIKSVLNLSLYDCWEPE